MRIALSTCRDLPDWEVDDHGLIRALNDRGANVHQPAWDDASFDWERCDACLIRTTWDYMDRWQEYVNWADRVSSCTRLFNPLDVVLWNTSKQYLKQLQGSGIAIIPTVWIEGGARPGSDAMPDIHSILQERGWSRAFLKPCVGAGASNTLRFEADQAGIAAAEAHLSRLLDDHSFMLQPYLSSVESQGEFSAIFIDGHFTHGVQKIPVAGDYRVQDDFGASDQPHDFSAEEVSLAREIVKLASEFTGEPDLLYARVDFLRGGDGELLLNELELVEPSLFFRHSTRAADALADGLLARL